jgi:hypothetical protein
MNNDFLGYVGAPDIHDAIITKVEQQADDVSVSMRAVSGRVFSIKFKGVKSTRSSNAVGMTLYSLSEMQFEKPYRHFVFTNAENDQSDAHLEIVAEKYEVVNAV